MSYLILDYLIHVSGKKIMSTPILGTESRIPATGFSPVAKVTLSIASDGANFESPAASARFKGCRSFTVERITSHPTLRGNACTVRIFLCTLAMIWNGSQNVQVGWNWIQWDYQIPQTAGHSQTTNPAGTQQNLELCANAIALCSVKELRALSPMSKCSWHWKTQPQPLGHKFQVT